MAVSLPALDLAFNSVNSFRAKDLLAEHEFDIQSVTVEEAKHDKVALQKQGEGNRWRFTQPPYGEADYEGETVASNREGQSAGGVGSVLRAVAALRVDSDKDFVADDVSDLAKYGLEQGKPERMRIEVRRNASGFGADKKQVTLTLLVGKNADDKGDKVYARLEGEKNVVRTDAKNLEPGTKLV